MYTPIPVPNCTLSHRTKNEGWNWSRDLAGQRAPAGLHWPAARSQLKIIVLIFMVLIITSLGSALYFLIKDKGSSTRTAKALTWRALFSITLFALLMLAYHFGLITTKL
jgi:hypothetical protein